MNFHEKESDLRGFSDAQRLKILLNLSESWLDLFSVGKTSQNAGLRTLPLFSAVAFFDSGAFSNHLENSLFT